MSGKMLERHSTNVCFNEVCCVMTSFWEAEVVNCNTCFDFRCRDQVFVVRCRQGEQLRGRVELVHHNEGGESVCDAQPARLRTGQGWHFSVVSHNVCCRRQPNDGRQAGQSVAD